MPSDLDPDAVRRLSDMMRDAGPPAGFGKYDLEERLGQGGMGVVYRARDRELGRVVALKVLRPGLADSRLAESRFRREAQNAARLHHPGIVTVYEAGAAGGLDYIAMEYVPGRTLQELIAARAIPLRQAVVLLEAVARAVDHAHTRGIVHRDLKPANIIVDADGRPHILDFGLAVAPAVDAALTASGAALGTPMYMSPEQVRGHRADIDHRSDVWALGVMLYELLDHPPFFADTIGAVYDRILHDNPPMPAGDAGLGLIALKAIEKSPARRYATAAAFADELKRWLAGEPLAVRPPSTFERAARAVRRHAFAYASVALLLVLATAAAVLYGRFRAAQSRRDALEPYLLKLRALPRTPGAVEEARRILDDAARACGPSSALWFERAEIERRIGSSPRALDALDQALKLNPSNFMALYARGRVRMTLEDAAGARADFEACLRLDPKNDFARIGQATLLLLDRRFDDALALAESVARASPHLPDAWSVCGAALRELRRHAEAVDRCAEALRLDPDDVSARVHRGLALADLGRWDEALQDHTRVVELKPEDAPAWENRGVLLMRMNRCEAAAADFRRVLELRPGDAQDHLNLAVSLDALGRRDEALAACERAIALADRDPQPWVRRAALRLARDDVSGAIDDCTRAIAIAPDFAPAYHQRCDALARAGRLDDARADLDRAIALAPDAVVYAKRADLRLRRQDYAGAAGDAQAAIDRDASLGLPYSVQAQIAHRDGACEQAIALYTSAIDRGHAPVETWYGRADARWQLGQHAEAIADLTEGVKRHPGAPDLWAKRGWFRAQEVNRSPDRDTALARMKEAAADFDEALRVAPPDWNGRAPAVELRDRLQRRIRELEPR